MIRLTRISRNRLPSSLTNPRSIILTARPYSKSSTSSMSSIQTTSSNLPIGLSNKLETMYTNEKVLEVLGTKGELVRPGSPLFDVVLGYTNLQLKLLKNELEKPVAKRDHKIVESSFEYLRESTMRIKSDKILKDKVRLGVTKDHVVLFDVIQYKSEIKVQFDNSIENIISNYEGKELVTRLFNTMDTFQGIASLLNVKWIPMIPFDQLLKLSPIIIEASEELGFYKRLIEGNSPIVRSNALRQLRSKLRNGNRMSAHLYQFEDMFETEDQQTIDQLKERFVNLYSFDMIRQITTRFINKNDEKARTYLELLITKASLEAKSNKLETETKKTKQELYECVMYLSTRMGNYNNTLHILDQMNENGIEMTPKIFHSVFTSLRHKKFYDAALLILRNVPETMFQDEKFKRSLITDFLVLLREKFPDNPVMVLSHYTAVFNNVEVLFNELGLLSLMLPSKTIGKLAAYDPKSLPQADLPDKFILGECYPTMRNMTDVYTFVLTYMSKHHSLKSLALYNELYELFINHATLIQANEESQPILRNHPFSSRHLDDAILNTFLKRVLRDFKSPSVALKMIEQFIPLKSIKFDPTSLTYIFSLHHDPAALTRMISLMERYKIQPDFAYITGQIFKSYNSKDIDTAKRWYDILCAWKFPIKSGRLIRFIHKMGWGFPAEFDQKWLEIVLQGGDLTSSGLELYESEEDEVHDEKFVQELKKRWETKA